MASKAKQKSNRNSRENSRNRGNVTTRHVIEDDVIVEEVLPEEEEYSQMNFLTGRDEVSSAKMQEIYDRKFAPPRPKSDSSLRSGAGAGSKRMRTVDLTSARKYATANGDAFARRRGEETQVKTKDENDEVDEVQVEKIVKQMKAAKVYDYDAELGIRTIEADSDSSSSSGSSSDEEEDNGNKNQNQNVTPDGAGVAAAVAAKAVAKKKKKEKKKLMKAKEGQEEESDIDPLFGKRGKCPLQLLSEFIDAITKKEFDSALNLCEMILIFEPTNEIALEFIPNLKEKIQIDEEQGSSSDESSDDSDDDFDDDDESDDDDDDEF